MSTYLCDAPEGQAASVKMLSYMRNVLGIMMMTTMMVLFA